MYKLNCDAALNQKASWVWDPGCAGMDSVVLMAVRNGLSTAKSAGLWLVAVEIDSLMVINLLKCDKLNVTHELGMIMIVKVVWMEVVPSWIEAVVNSDCTTNVH
ncbi:hypothetical protein TorRG33x02_214200 [Trema orientale]|uniref:Uncharacterized protein n=1 Tax=Trema orientale TaxID=63057 RepID=A0A2P5EBG3_TREOI|nr:hypothetical protein TorRG33x02_214200 [Trema orientale]